MDKDWSCLKGVRILDVSRYLPGPYTSMLLSVFGMDVIRIDDPKTGDPVLQLGEPVYNMLNVNKRSIALNLGSGQGQSIFKTLVARSDAVIEGFRPGVMNRLGLGYADLNKINPALVFCSISGFGQSGPYAGRSGHDLSYLALSGYFSVPSQVQDKTARPKIRLADYSASMFAALSLAVAVMSARASGLGQHLDVSIHGAISSWVAPLALMMQESWGNDIRRMPHIMPDNDLFVTGDGKTISLSIMENKFWISFRDLLKDEHPRLAEPQYDQRPGRMQHKHQVNRLLSEVFASKTLQDWESILDQTDIPWAPVYDNPDDFLNDPQVVLREVLKSFESLRLPSFPVRFSNGLEDIYRRPPRPGEHTQEILRELGYDATDIEAFRASGVI